MAVNPYPKGSTDAAMWDYQNATDEFKESKYTWEGDYTPEEMNYLEMLKDTELGDVEYDQGLSDMEMLAISELEDQSKTGLSMRDKADMAAIEAEANRANRGRQGAIKQNMASRGMSGSGLDMMMQQQAAQDSAEMEAIAGLERAAQIQEGKRSATAKMGMMAGDKGQRDWQRDARKAEAQDAINRFNTGNRMDVDQYNNDMRNSASKYNHAGRQNVSEANTDLQAHFFDADQNKATIDYNAAVDARNKAEQRKAARRARKVAAIGQGVGVVGGVVGAVYGGPAGAAAGYAGGSAAGNMAGEAMYAKGGRVNGDPEYPGDDYRNDTTLVRASGEEIFIPRTKAKDPQDAKRFVDDVFASEGHESDDSDEVIEGLIQAVNYLNNKKRR